MFIFGIFKLVSFLATPSESSLAASRVCACVRAYPKQRERERERSAERDLSEKKVPQKERERKRKEIRGPCFLPSFGPENKCVKRRKDNNKPVIGVGVVAAVPTPVSSHGGGGREDKTGQR